MNTLIIYVTKHGTTEKCAKMLAEKLTGRVDVCNLKSGDIPSLQEYDKVIIGGSIYAGRIHKEITDFCAKNLNILYGKKTGCFICGMNLASADTELGSAFPQELLVKSVTKECFGGEFKFKEMNFMERAVTKMVSKSLAKKEGVEIDFKNDISKISEESINRFALLMNNA